MSVKKSSKSLLDRLLLFNSPYDKEALEDIRMKLLEQMKTAQTPGKPDGFSHYLNQMSVLKKEIDQVIIDDDKLLDDEYWSRGSQKDIYWKKESPWLEKSFEHKKWLRLRKHPSGVKTITDILAKETTVDKFIGDSQHMTIQQLIIFKTFLLTYFKNDERLWPVELNMDFSFLNTREKEQEKNQNQSYKDQLKTLFKSALSGAGPFVLKILQQINTSNSSKVEGGLKVSELAEDIFSTVPGLTEKESKFVVNSFQIDKTYIEKMNPKLLGSASIAETHITQAPEKYDYPPGTPTKVILKFIKPLYAYFFMCECNFLLTSAWKYITIAAKGDKKYIKQCRKLMMFFIGEFMKEFDYMGEFNNTILGYQNYNEENGIIKSILAVDCVVDPFPVLILSMAKGNTVDNLLKKTSDIEKDQVVQLYKYLDQLITKWFKITLWGSGFFHADLHPGNVMADDVPELFIIDYGSCGILTKRQQCLLITSMIISGQFWQIPLDQFNTLENQKKHQKNIETSKKFVKVIWEVCEVYDYTHAHLQHISEKILNYKKGLYYNYMFLDIIKYSDDIGTCSNNAVLLFGRALAYLGDLMKAVVDKCDDKNLCPVWWQIDSIIKTNLIAHPHQLVLFLTKGRVCTEDKAITLRKEKEEEKRQKNKQ